MISIYISRKLLIAALLIVAVTVELCRRRLERRHTIRDHLK